MSALRVNLPGLGLRHLDPYTRATYRPVLATFTEAAPVTIRQATPEERAAAIDVRGRTNIRLLPRNARPKGIYIAHLSDAEVLAAVATYPTQAAAAASLGVSQPSISRRLRQIRAGVVR